MNRQSVILSAYREAVFEATEVGLKGQRAAHVAIRAAARISSRLLNSPITEHDVLQTISG
jgi:hypothetical protein